MTPWRKLFLATTIFIASGIVMILGCYIAVSINARGRTFDDVNDVPAHEYGLLLATSPFTPQGAHNYYFDNRIQAVAELYKAGKIKKIIASGGDYRASQKFGYDEPVAIRDSLVVRGIPEDRIILDYEGTRTYNSIAKAKRNGIRSFVIISQKYHNERSLCIAKHLGYNDVDIVAYNAKPSHIQRSRIKNTLREYLARVKMYIDFLTLTPAETLPYKIHESPQDFEHLKPVSYGAGASPPKSPDMERILSGF